MRVQDTIEISASASRVWMATLDVESLPDYTSTVKSIELLDSSPLAVGSRVRIKQPFQRAKVWTVDALDHERRFVWSTTQLGHTMTATHEVADTTAATTANTLTVDVVGPAARLLGPLLRHPIQNALGTENRGLKTAVEGGPAIRSLTECLPSTTTQTQPSGRSRSRCAGPAPKANR